MGVSLPSEPLIAVRANEARPIAERIASVPGITVNRVLRSLAEIAREAEGYRQLSLDRPARRFADGWH